MQMGDCKAGASDPIVGFGCLPILLRSIRPETGVVSGRLVSYSRASVAWPAPSVRVSQD